MPSLPGVPSRCVNRLAAAPGLVHAPPMVHHCNVTQKTYACNSSSSQAIHHHPKNEHVRMNMPAHICLPLLRPLVLSGVLALAPVPAAFGDDTVVIGGQTYVNK